MSRLPSQKAPEDDPMSAQIVILLGPERGQTFSIPTGATLVVGRALETQTQLTDPAVSRLHCEIANDGAQSILKNLSDRGTQVNGKPVTQHTLRHGDVVRIGGTEFRFVLGSMEDSDTILQSAPVSRTHATE
jgi:S-DNA-T family DNA segregation ATPase FtsK/SpoIIIE